MSKRTVKQRVQERRSRRQSQGLVIGGVVIAAIAVVVILVALGNASTAAAPVDVTRYQGLPQEIDRTGAPGLSLGSKDAVATLVEYSDFSCPHCRDMADTIHQLIDQYVRDGKLRIIYKPVSFINPTYSPSAARAVLCGAEQGKGWEMHDAVWSVFDSNSPGAYSLDVFAVQASAIQLDMPKFRQCYDASSTTTALAELEAERVRLGVNSTPTILLNGQIIDIANIFAEVQAAVGG